MFERLNNFLDSFLDMQVPGYDCLVYKDGESVYRRTKGYSDLEQKIPMKGTERFNMYSCSKLLTCTAALQLLEKKAYNLQDQLADYMPEFADMKIHTPNGLVPAKNRITIWNLFTMTAGFSYDTQSPSLLRAFQNTHGSCPTRETMKYLAQEPLYFEPGTKWAYSLCHDVLAAFVEVLTGMTFNDYLVKNIFEPLGMKHTTFLLPETELGTIAPQYARSAYNQAFVRISPAIQNSDFTRHSFRLGTDYASGGAGCVSTVNDYLLFLEALRQGDVILSRKTIRQMATNALSPELAASYWNTDYGYGLGVRCPIAGQSPTDFGWGGAAGAYMGIDLTYNYTFFYAQHVLYPLNSQERHKIPEVIRQEFA